MIHFSLKLFFFSCFFCNICPHATWSLFHKKEVRAPPTTSLPCIHTLIGYGSHKRRDHANKCFPLDLCREFHQASIFFASNQLFHGQGFSHRIWSIVINIDFLKIHQLCLQSFRIQWYLTLIWMDLELKIGSLKDKWYFNCHNKVYTSFVLGLTFVKKIASIEVLCKFL